MSALPAPEREALAGLVERVTFHSPDSGFCVLRVKVRGQRELVTVVGAAAAISAGEFIQASGSWVNDRTHGLQFKAAFLRAAPPTTREGIERYLGSGMIKGIGPVYAKRLVRAFGKEVFELIEQSPLHRRDTRAAAGGAGGADAGGGDRGARAARTKALVQAQGVAARAHGRLRIAPMSWSELC